MGLCGWKKSSNVSMQNSLDLIYRQGFLNTGTEGELVQKMAELSQISLDDTSWMADV